jgi:GT2 family glycosyltransferase
MSVRLPGISIVIVGHNDKKYLNACLNSIRRQTVFNRHDIEVIYINNASFDGSIAEIQRHFKWVKTVRNMKNVGYAAALNQGIKISRGDFLLLMNADVILEKDYLEKALNKMMNDKHIGALMGKIYRYDFNLNVKTNVFDTVGIFAWVDREILSARGAEDMGQFEDSQEIFSIRNICGLYRRTALEDTKIKDEFFDENFFLYLEDLDICWRMHLFGWRIYFLPSLVSYHCIDSMKKSQITEYKRRERREFVLNERLMTLKNEFFLTMLKDIIIIFKKRFIKKSFIMDKWFSGLVKYLKLIPGTLKKRRHIMKHRRTNRLEMRRYFIRKSNMRYSMYKSKSLYKYAKLPPVY